MAQTFFLEMSNFEREMVKKPWISWLQDIKPATLASFSQGQLLIMLQFLNVARTHTQTQSHCCIYVLFMNEGPARYLCP